MKSCCEDPSEDPSDFIWLGFLSNRSSKLSDYWGDSWIKLIYWIASSTNIVVLSPYTASGKITISHSS